MDAPFGQLLDATIRHLEALRGRGIRHVPVSPSLVGSLRAPVSPGETALQDEERQAGSSGVGQSPPSQQRIGPTPPDLLVPGHDALPIPSPMKREDREKAFAELRPEVLACQKCPHLVRSRTQVVFGVGNIHAELMFVGEAPGADEDEQGEPFVGRAGQLLTRIIQTMGFKRQDVYIANVLKCRPDTPGQTSGNRKPTPDEMQTCLPHLREQIRLIQPRVMVALGATAVEGLLGKTAGITRLRGNWQMFQGIPLMPTYHPAYLLRNQSLSEKRKVWEDMLKVMERLGLPISAKQRGFFLNSGST